ncbi:MAG: hypothetical protein GY953_23755, partial [bacterium]|nr:hypothetical protein [bacterium]
MKLHARLILALAALPALLAAQGLGGAGDLSARAQQDINYAKSLTTEPGGTPEDKLWQVLVLMGVGDTEPSEWTGDVAVTAGDLHSVEGYRFELP